jgi:hypothetical protein
MTPCSISRDLGKSNQVPRIGALVAPMAEGTHFCLSKHSADVTVEQIAVQE